MTRKKFGCGKILLILFGVMVALSLVWIAANLGSSPVAGKQLFEPSVEANAITSPLDENGDVDYLAALNDLASKGIDPEDNAVVKFVQAIGPTPEGVTVSPEFFERLGIESLPEEGDYFVTFESWLAKQDAEGDGEDMGMQMRTQAEMREFLAKELMFDFAIEHPWTADDLPAVQQWLRECEPSIKLFDEGLSRTKYYMPIVPPQRAERMLLHGNLSHASLIRDVGRLYFVRGGRALGNQDFDAVFAEAMSLQKLAELSSRSSTIVEYLLSMSFQYRANELVNRIVTSPGVTESQLRRFFVELGDVKDTSEVARIIDTGERFTGIEAIQHHCRNSNFGIDLQNKGEPVFMNRLVDYEQAMIVMNATYDWLVQKFEGSNRQQIRARLDSYENEMKDKEAELVSVWTWAKAIVGGRKAKGRMAGKIFSSTLMPAVRQVYDSETRQLTQQHLLRLLFAIEIFKRNHDGQPPKNLEQLVPEFLKQIPMDPFDNSPFDYRVGKDGSYLLLAAEKDSNFEAFEPKTWSEYLKENLEESNFGF